jgi:hypothetical protein
MSLQKNNRLHQRDVSRYFTIADAKRGDKEHLLNAKAFEDLNFDSVCYRGYKRFSEPFLAFRQNTTCLP